MIKIEEYDKKNQKLVLITDMPVSLVNAIRRSVLEIPIMAIEDVEIIKNDSALYDEIIAHRLGLIPIKTTKINKEIQFRINEKGPKTVYSTDIKPSIETNYKLPIVILDNEQEFQIIATAKLGKGIEHIKYSPGLFYFKHNLEPEFLDFIYVDKEGKTKIDEEELKGKITEEMLKKIKKINKITEIVINIESWGQIDVKEIFLKAVKALEDNLKELDKITK